ncbi:hypothetical protein NC651_001289 [Populus alba x Populus x berolinensis]|nr:hypothetical protein NC651_001289 [Populus alba x Populus x berolinensis]
MKWQTLAYSKENCKETNNLQSHPCFSST